jgi:hypothetical protein
MHPRQTTERVWSEKLLQGLVTFDPSTFSSYLVEHRLLHMGVPRETATCVFGLCKNVPDAQVWASRHMQWAVACMFAGSGDTACNALFASCTCCRPG